MIRIAALAATLAFAGAGGASADVTRHPIPNSDFPIAQAVEIQADATIVLLSFQRLGGVPAVLRIGRQREDRCCWSTRSATTR